ncbi:MAG TPA: response regulator, partial [Blastocatellia bacterium]|nr:response regulator [Blastocatellia bacterium]
YLCEALRTTLEHEGYRVTVALTGREGLDYLTNGEGYDLVLLDVVLPEMDGWAILSEARASITTFHIPIIMLTAMTDEMDEVRLLGAGADDYIAKPFSFDKLLARVNAMFRRAALQCINPATGLPGNRQVEQFLQECVKETETFWAAAYADIDSFKSYNDCYGFLRGDEVLRATAVAMVRTATDCSHSVFVGNIGRDDFLIGFRKRVPREDDAALVEVQEVLDRVAARFDDMTREFYKPEDIARGYLESESRRGGIERHPLMALSIAVVSNNRRLFSHPLEINNAFTSVKRKAKAVAGSTVYIDQRRR